MEVDTYFCYSFHFKNFIQIHTLFERAIIFNSNNVFDVSIGVIKIDELIHVINIWGKMLICILQSTAMNIACVMMWKIWEILIKHSLHIARFAHRWHTVFVPLAAQGAYQSHLRWALANTLISRFFSLKSVIFEKKNQWKII